MVQITVSDDLARQVADATAPIVLVDSSGRRVGTVSPSWMLPPEASEEEVVGEIKRRMANDDGFRRPFADLVKELRERSAE
jgi:hypothetical protein